MGFWKGVKSVGKSISRREQEIAEKPRLLNSSTKQLIVLGAVVIMAAYVGTFLLKYSILDGDKWRMLATGQQQEVVVIKANRGTIYDSNGTVLAQSSTVWDITISPHDIDLNNTAAK